MSLPLPSLAICLLPRCDCATSTLLCCRAGRSPGHALPYSSGGTSRAHCPGNETPAARWRLCGNHNDEEAPHTGTFLLYPQNRMCLCLWCLGTRGHRVLTCDWSHCRDRCSPQELYDEHTHTLGGLQIGVLIPSDTQGVGVPW